MSITQQLELMHDDLLYLRFKFGGVEIIGWLLGDLLEHLVESHVQVRIGLDQVLELLDNSFDIFWCLAIVVCQSLVLHVIDALLEPIVENLGVLGQPPTATVQDRLR